VVRLTRKLAQVIDGIDLTDHEVGELISLSPLEARVLIAEGWAEPIVERLARTPVEQHRAMAADSSRRRKRR
jgi:hypothetical protein